MPKISKLKSILEKNENLREILFSRGFLLTNQIIQENDYPFYNNWIKSVINECELFLYTHKKTQFKIKESSNEKVIILGHAYNPFDYSYKEDEILNNLLNNKTLNEKIDYINQLTGVFTLIFINKDNIVVFGDCSCMQSTYYYLIDNNLYLSSHSQLIGDLCGLKTSNYVTKLINYKFWHLYGRFLPGDTSQFSNVYRLVPNTYVKIINNEDIEINRFFPVKDNIKVKSDKEYKDSIDFIAKLLNVNLELITKKWKKPAISMTGGMDSKTTVACANGLYNKFKFYSYVSIDGDKIDNDAAKKIAEVIGVNHETHYIQTVDIDSQIFEEFSLILEHNYGNIGKYNKNDLEKILYYLNNSDFDVEVKSWISEIGRANYYKKFGVKKMPTRLSPRQMSSMYKLFTYNRITALKTDKIFKEYIKKTDFKNIFNYDASDMYLWEFRYGSWGGNVITYAQRIPYDITIPYNNRILINEFLKLPLEKRIKDFPHYDIIKEMNSKIDELGITITNYNETKMRKFFEKIYFRLHNFFPF